MFVPCLCLITALFIVLVEYTYWGPLFLWPLLVFSVPFITVHPALLCDSAGIGGASHVICRFMAVLSRVKTQLFVFTVQQYRSRVVFDQMPCSCLFADLLLYAVYLQTYCCVRCLFADLLLCTLFSVKRADVHGTSLLIVIADVVARNKF